MKTSFITFFFAFVALVAAQSSSDSPFYITYPLTGAKFKAGDEVDLTWINGLDQTVKVTVIEGADSKAMSVTGISFNVNGDDGSYTWKVPSSLAPSATYAFQFEYKNDKGATQYSYSGPVSVSGGTGVASGTASATSATSASSQASSSAAPTSSSASASSSQPASSSVKSSSSSSVPASSSSTSSATATPSPSNSAAGLKITSIVLAVPALVLAALYA